MNEILDDHLAKSPKPKQSNRTYYFLLVALLIGSVIATLTAWYEVEFIVASGPIMSIVGIILSILARKRKDMTGALIGLIPFLLSAFWVIIISLFDLSPNDCRTITPLSMTVGTIIILVLGIRSFVSLD